jgi:hypothetical protein
LEETIFTLKIDGRNAYMKDGNLYLRQELKEINGKFPEPPKDWIECQKEPKNGHWPFLR